MRKLILLFFCLQLGFGRGQLKDSAYIWNWVPNEEIWRLDGKSYYSYTDGLTVKEEFLSKNVMWDSSFPNGTKNIYTFDSNNNLIEKLIMVKDTSGWKNLARLSYKINTNNKVDTFNYHIWNGTSWENYWRYIYSYNPAQTEFVETQQTFTNGNWENHRKDIYLYDVTGKIISCQREVWQANSWNKSIKYSTYYDANNNKIKVENFGWIDLQWKFVGQEICRYNSSNFITCRTEQIPGQSGWHDNSRDSSTYDSNNNLISFLSQTYSDGWNNYMLILSTYDSNNNCKDNLQLNWGGQSWNYQTRYSFTSNIYNLRASAVRETWTGTNWNKLDSSYYYFPLVSGIEDQQTEKKMNVNVYPNPSKGFIKIAGSRDLFFKLYDLSGREIYSGSVLAGQVVDFSDKQKGIYLLEVSDKTERQIKKVIIE